MKKFWLKISIASRKHGRDRDPIVRHSFFSTTQDAARHGKLVYTSKNHAVYTAPHTVSVRFRKFL